MNIKAVLFDHDGTIVDSEQTHFEMWKNILSFYNVALSYAEYNNHYAGIPTTTNAKVLIDKYALDVDVTELILAKTHLTNKYLAKQSFALMDGAFAAIRYFHERGLKVGIVTGARSEGVSNTLEKYGLGQYISVVVSGDDVVNSKPAADCYLLAVEKLGLQSSECLAIEDTYNGSLSAIRANIKCIGVSASQRVRNSFSKTVYQCSDLSSASQWISKNLLL